ncbi:hypothetical protein NSQ26_14175 [Bacillus sp. FSL W7-1360]
MDKTAEMDASLDKTFAEDEVDMQLIKAVLTAGAESDLEKAYFESEVDKCERNWEDLKRFTKSTGIFN